MIPILVLLILQFSTNGFELCNEAINDIKIVESCPTSKEKRDKAAIKKNCTGLAELRNCTNAKNQLQYHCVINAYMNETLEVCAPTRFIFGFCTEFNDVGKVIQGHYDARCNSKFPKCDPIYSSVYAYKFPDCYELVYGKRDSITTVLPQRIKSTDETDRFNSFGEITFATYSCILVFVYLSYLICLLKQVKRKKNTNTRNEKCELMKIKRETESKQSVVYFYFNPKQFDHFNDVYNRTMDYMHHLKNNQVTKERKHAITMDVIVKVGIVGEFTDNNLKLFPNGERSMSRGSHSYIWEAVPLLCFQNNLSLHSALKALRTESACHKILIKSENATRNETDEIDNSIIMICQNKEKIVETITSCLMQPICQMEKRWLKYLEAEYAIIFTSEIIENLQVIHKKTCSKHG